MKRQFALFSSTALCIITGTPAPAIPSGGGGGATGVFDQGDFAVTPDYNDVQTFGFTIDLDGPIVAGQSYINPALTEVVYNVFGTLSGTPSGFPAFNLQRTIVGNEFYTQGSSLAFDVSLTADLSDGLQVAELLPVSPVLNPEQPVFVFNGREVGTGRYHPALVQLYADGTGFIMNANNTGGINPATAEVVGVTYGEEYITNLTFDPNTLTLFTAENVPEPGSLLALTILSACCATRRRSGGTRR